VLEYSRAFPQEVEDLKVKFNEISRKTNREGLIFLSTIVELIDDKWVDEHLNKITFENLFYLIKNDKFKHFQNLDEFLLAKIKMAEVFGEQQINAADRRRYEGIISSREIAPLVMDKILNITPQDLNFYVELVKKSKSKDQNNFLHLNQYIDRVSQNDLLLRRELYRFYFENIYMREKDEAEVKVYLQSLLSQKNKHEELIYFLRYTKEGMEEFIEEALIWPEISDHDFLQIARMYERSDELIKVIEKIALSGSFSQRLKADLFLTDRRNQNPIAIEFANSRSPIRALREKLRHKTPY
jgi:hypothetical protein